MKYTIMPPLRIAALEELMRSLDVDGAFVQCGVGRGGSAAAMAHAGKLRHVWLFDSFQMMPPPTEEDGDKAMRRYEGILSDSAYIGRSAAIVRKAFGDYPRDHLHIMSGWFKATFPITDVGPVAVLHLDADWYNATRLSLERFWPDLVPGGLLILDDYGHWPGCKRAADEFLGKPLEWLDYTCAWVRK